MTNETWTNETWTNETWHYDNGREAVGPVSAAMIVELIGRGLIRAETHVWRQGLAGWEAAQRHFDFGRGAAAGSGADAQAAAPEGPAMSERARRYMLKKAAEPARAAPGQEPYHRRRGHGLYHLAPARGFLEAVKVCLRKYVTFSGRASRSEYWYFILFTLLLAVLSAYLDSVLFGVAMSSDIAGPLNTAAALAVFVPTLAVGWRRLHDIGRSGWWIGGFILAVPVVLFLMLFTAGTAVLSPAALSNALFLLGALAVAFVIYSILMLVFMLTRGDPGPNRFG